MDENSLEAIGNATGAQNAPFDTHLSDVIEVIAGTDPDFEVERPSASLMRNRKMYNGGGEMPSATQQSQGRRGAHGAHVEIVEQPASKALRFRYECEGRSAGSIPGASSTPENKTYPSIRVVGYQGRAVVVVSCVTKDPPYKAHPHNLVGREGCKRGVCTLEIPPDTMTVQFSNLGIQCVKKRDIESALRVREEIRVDPFRQGFNHRNQPTSIDLNAVRLCFQVFIEGDVPRKFSVPLPPVVSEPIYDKKAMSDLSIIKLSDCVSYVDGGRKDIILLCEKVAKEDIQVRFYEEKDGHLVWEGYADFQPSQVHKQHAIWFRTPRYKSLDVTEPVRCFIQLRRPSDGITSEPLPFELLPLDAGRSPHWPFRKKPNLKLFQSILPNDKPLAETTPVKTDKAVVATATETNNNETKPPDYSEVHKLQEPVLVDNNNTEEKSFNELINQVAELDEIYTETQARLLTGLTETSLREVPQNESFDDAKTYSSLQLAFKNPIEVEFDKKYEDVVLNSPSPVPETVPGKRENENFEPLPPLPPKRSKKIETYIGGSMSSIQEAASLLNRSNSSLKSVPVSRSHSFNLQRPKSQGELVPPGKNLPPTPACSTLPNPKKRGFFSKLFHRKSKTPCASREASVTPSFASTKSLQPDVINKSASNISMTHSTGSSIRVPLKGDSHVITECQNVTDKIDLTSDDDIDMNLDLTEAEHYALYTAVAPHATQSEFDEMSCYYAPVEGGKLLSNAEVMARLASKS